MQVHPSGIVQVAFVVDDIRTAMPFYARQFGIGPWFLFEHFEFDWVEYRGKPATIDLSLCLGYSGGMMFELIEQHDLSPSVYRETIDQRGYGFHHNAVTASAADYDATKERYLADGASLALEAEVAVGGRASYLEFGDRLPGMIELIELTEKVEQLFGHIRSANDGWLGQDPVRTLG